MKVSFFFALARHTIHTIHHPKARLHSGAAFRGFHLKNAQSLYFPFTHVLLRFTEPYFALTTVDRALT